MKIPAHTTTKSQTVEIKGCPLKIEVKYINQLDDYFTQYMAFMHLKATVNSESITIFCKDEIDKDLINRNFSGFDVQIGGSISIKIDKNDINIINKTQEYLKKWSKEDTIGFIHLIENNEY